MASSVKQYAFQVSLMPVHGSVDRFFLALNIHCGDGPGPI